MPVTINGDGSITGLSVGGLGSGVVNTATLANGAATQAKRTYATGEIIQTQSFIFTSVTESFSSKAWHATSVTKQLTPTASSNKILVMATLTAGNSNNVGEGAAFKVMRSVNGGSYTETVAYGDAVGSANRGSVGGFYDNNTIYTTDCRSIQFIDTPNTTLPVDYKIYVYLFDGNATVYINRPHTTTALEHITGTSSIVLMEVKG